MLPQRGLLPDAGAECWTLLGDDRTASESPQGERVAVMRWNKQTIEAGGVRLAARDSGGHGTPVVLVHGLGTIQRSWDRLAPLLVPHLRVVTYDQRGHGRSQPATDYTPDAFTADLRAVLDALDLERPVLVGHSLGALLAVEVAAARPGCAGVVAVDGGLPVTRPPEATDQQAFRAELARPLQRLLGRLTTALGLGVRLSAEELWQLMQRVEARERAVDQAWARLTCPALLVLAAKADPVPWGEAMQAAKVEAAHRFQQAHPQVEQVWLDCGHAIPLQRPQELAAQIVRFAA
jgi:pimeloyl-ACP methyl ester carboxylesterase